MKIVRNAIKCLKCNQVVVSTHVHHFNWCSCGAVAVDGGNEYLKRTGNHWDYAEACMYDAATSKEPNELIGKWLIYSPGGKTNSRTACDRREDAESGAKQMAKQTGSNLWYIVQLVGVAL